MLGVSDSDKPGWAVDLGIQSLVVFHSHTWVWTVHPDRWRWAVLQSGTHVWAVYSDTLKLAVHSID